MDKAISAAIDAATTGKQEQPAVEVPAKVETSAPNNPGASVADEGKAVTQAPKEKQNAEWDGSDVTILPLEIQAWAKRAQAGLTKKAMAQSELIKKGQEYSDFQQSEDWKQFQAYKSNPTPQAPGKEAPAKQDGGVTPEEWEAAMLDSTGQVASLLLRREAERVVAAKEAQYGQKIQSLEHKNQIADFKMVLSEFADQHPDVYEMHEDEYFMPILDAEISSGKHKNYESAISIAYEKAAKIKAKADARALSASQGRVAEKKGAVVSTGTSTGSISSIEVAKDDVLQKSIEAALEGKKVNVKARR